jgi:hypothetical protein
LAEPWGLFGKTLATFGKVMSSKTRRFRLRV